MIRVGGAGLKDEAETKVRYVTDVLPKEKPTPFLRGPLWTLVGEFQGGGKTIACRDLGHAGGQEKRGAKALGLVWAGHRTSTKGRQPKTRGNKERGKPLLAVNGKKTCRCSRGPC